MGVRELTVVDAAGVPTRPGPDHRRAGGLVNDIAARPETWSQHVAFDADERVYVSLHRDNHVDVWLLC